MSSRWVNVAMGAALIGTGVAARGAERANNLALGLSIFLLAFLAMGFSRVRRLNTVLGAWAAISPFALAYRDALPGWTAVVGGGVVVIASLWPDRRPRPWGAMGERAA